MPLNNRHQETVNKPQEDDYILRLPRIRLPGKIKIFDLYHIMKYGRVLSERGLTKSQRGVVNRVLGIAWRKGLTVGELRRMTDEEILNLEAPGMKIGERSLLIIRTLFGYEDSDKIKSE